MLAFVQAGVWRDSVTLFTRAVAVNPDSAGMHNNLGRALGERGDLAAAEQQFLETLRTAPYDPFAHRNLALIAVKRGDTDAAIRYLSEAIRLTEAAGQDASDDRRDLQRLLRTRAAPTRPAAP
jgi:Flp pilus assembly protein TadD